MAEQIAVHKLTEAEIRADALRTWPNLAGTEHLERFVRAALAMENVVERHCTDFGALWPHEMRPLEPGDDTAD